MSNLADLHRTVQTTLASKRLGVPVFVRYLLQGTDKPDAIVARLAQVAAAARDWLGSPLARVCAVGSTASGQVSCTLEFQSGVTAQVSYAQGQVRGGGVDLLVLGNHGALYHDSGSAELWDEPLTPLDTAPDAALRALLEKALQSGKPEEAKP